MVCKTCGKEFFEDWRKKDKRSKEPNYCSFSCSHSRKHSEETKQKIKDSLLKRYPYEKKFCKICNKELNHRNKIGICIGCKPHVKKSGYVIDWRKKTKEELVNLKGGKCERCGYNKCLSALEFHHLDPKEKEFSISNKNIRSIEKYKKEIEKCILLCSNCHREEHEKIYNEK